MNLFESVESNLNFFHFSLFVQPEKFFPLNVQKHLVFLCLTRKLQLSPFSQLFKCESVGLESMWGWCPYSLKSFIFVWLSGWTELHVLSGLWLALWWAISQNNLSACLLCRQTLCLQRDGELLSRLLHEAKLRFVIVTGMHKTGRVMHSWLKKCNHVKGHQT